MSREVFIALLLPTVLSAPAIYQLNFDGATIEVDVGTPLQYLVLSPSTTTDITLLIDANCRPLFRADCPAYCVNTAFQQVYCPLDCVKDGHSVNCKDPAQFILENYQPLNSSTAVVSSDTWTGTLDLYTNQFGQWATDFFSFESADDDGQRLNVSEWPFVSGLVLDGGLFWNSNGVIGLAPGPSNFVQLLYERGEIPQPILSVVFDEFRFTVGDFGGDFCGEWLKFEVTNPHWMVAFQSAQLGDFHLQGNILVTFSLHLDNVFIPDEAFDRLFKKGIITNYAPNYFKILCTASIDLEFTGQDSRILLPSAFLIDGQPTDEDCYTSVLPLRDFYSAHLYADEPSFVAGLPFLSAFCVGYDYAVNQLGISSYTGVQPSRKRKQKEIPLSP